METIFLSYPDKAAIEALLRGRAKHIWARTTDGVEFFTPMDYEGKLLRMREWVSLFVRLEANRMIERVRKP